MIKFILGAVWLVLLIRSVMSEYKYYRAVKTLEPGIWNQLGSPVFLRAPMLFVSPRGVGLLKTVTNPAVLELASNHRRDGILFIAYIAVVLVGSIVFFNLA